MKHSEGYGGCRVRVIRGEFAGEDGSLYEHSRESATAFRVFLRRDDAPETIGPDYDIEAEDLELRDPPSDLFQSVRNLDQQISQGGIKIHDFGLLIDAGVNQDLFKWWRFTKIGPIIKEFNDLLNQIIISQQ